MSTEYACRQPTPPTGHRTTARAWSGVCRNRTGRGWYRPPDTGHPVRQRTRSRENTGRQLTTTSGHCTSCRRGPSADDGQLRGVRSVGQSLYSPNPSLPLRRRRISHAMDWHRNEPCLWRPDLQHFSTNNGRNAAVLESRRHHSAPSSQNWPIRIFEIFKFRPKLPADVVSMSRQTLYSVTGRL